MNSKLIASLVLIGLVISFTLQNTEVVDITFLFWTLSMSRAVMIFLVFILGLISGWIIRGYLRRRQRSKR